MAMTKEKIIEALRAAREVFRNEPDVTPRRLTEEEMGQMVGSYLDRKIVLDHLAFMCEEAEQMLSDDRREKVMRWLGFCQGALWGMGLSTISASKDANRPDLPEST
jgi:hypothetical protein